MASKMTRAEKERRKAAEQNAKAKKKKETGKSSSSSKLSQLVKNAIGGQKEKKTFTEAFEDNTKKLNIGRKTEKPSVSKKESVGEKVQIRDEARRNPLTKTGVRMPEKMDLTRGNTNRTREEMERRSSQRELAQMTPNKWLKVSRETVGLKENEKAGVGLGTIRHGTLNKNAELFSDNWDRIPKENQTEASIQIIYTYGITDQNRDMVMTAFHNASTYDKRKIMDAVVQTDGWSDVAQEMRQTINNAPDANQALMQQISEDMNVRNGNYLDTFQRAAGKAQVDQYNLQQKEDKIIADWAKENYNTVEAVKYSVMQSASGWLANTYDAVALAHSDLLNAGQQDNVTDGIGAPWRNTKNYEKFGDKVASVGTTVLHDLFRIVGLPISLLSKASYTPEEVDEITRKLMGVTDWYHEAVRNNQVALEGSNLSETQKTIAEITGMVVDQIPGIAMSVVGTPAAGMTTFGLQAGGKYGRSAYENGASIEDSVKFGLAAAAAEVATEKLFAGFGYFGKGLSSKILTDTTRKMLDNSAFKDSMSARILKRVVAGGGEATEEMIMELVQPYLERSTYDPTADGATLEEILRSGGLGFVVAQILGLPANALGVTADVMQKYDANMREKTLQENINAVIAEELESGRITEEQAANINAQIGDLRKGKGVLTQSEAKEETKVTGENLDTIYANHDEAREAMMEEAKTKKDGEKITARYIDKDGKAQLWETMVKDGKITAVRGGITTEAESAKYVAKSQKVASATNTAERTGYQLNVKDEIVKEVSALSKAFNREVEFYYDENSAVHGNVDLNTGKIYVNANSSQSPAAAVIAHEMTHLLENTSSYKTLTNMMQKYYASSLDDKRNDIIAIYKSNPEAMKTILDKDGKIKMDVIDSEVMAAFIEEKLLTDYNTIRELTRTDRTLAQKIVDWLNKVIQKITGSKEQKFLIEARDVWNKALKEGQGSATSIEGEQITSDTVEEIRYSQGNDKKLMDKADARNHATHAVEQEILDEAREARTNIKDKYSDLFIADSVSERKSPLVGNDSYAGSLDSTTICSRSLTLEAIVELVAKKFDRPLTNAEAIVVAQELMEYTGDRAECLYCYQANAKRGYEDALGAFLRERRTVIDNHRNGMDEDTNFKLMMNFNFEKGTWGKKPTDAAKDRFKTYIKIAEGKLTMAPASGMLNTRTLYASIADKKNPQYIIDQYKQARTYAQGAVKAHGRVYYAVYNGQVLRVKQNKIDDWNRTYGLRMYSFSDFSPAFILENMQMVTDAAVRKLRMLAYTKEPEFVEIFGDTGMAINISIAGVPDGNGGYHSDGMQGMDWETAKALRDRYPAAGTVYVAKDDAEVEWAMAQDWIDTVIPFHISYGSGMMQRSMGWTNYSGQQSEKKEKGWTKDMKVTIYPSEHQNDKDTYLRLCEENLLTPKFPKWKDNPNYMKLVNETRLAPENMAPVQPIFNVEAAEKSLEQFAKAGGYNPILGGSETTRDYIVEDIASRVEKNAPMIEERHRKYSLGSQKIPKTWNELVERREIEVVQIGNTPRFSGNTAGEKRTNIISDLDDRGVLNKPHLNKDTNTLIFVMKQGLQHSLKNLSADTIAVVNHVPEIIEKAAFIGKGRKDDSEKVYDTYALIAGAQNKKEPFPVKLIVKEYRIGDGVLPPNVKKYLETDPEMREYARFYDAKVLVAEIEEAGDPDRVYPKLDDAPTTPASMVSLAELLEPVKEELREYLPKDAFDERRMSLGRPTDSKAERRRRDRQDEATMREYDRLMRQISEDERKQDEATMRMHDRLIKEVYNEAKSLSAEEKRDIRRVVRKKGEEKMKKELAKRATQYRKERSNARQNLNAVMKEAEKQAKNYERKLTAQENEAMRKKQEKTDRERRSERLRIVKEEYKRNAPKPAEGSAEAMYFANNDAKELIGRFRRNIITYLVEHEKFISPNEGVVLDENGMEIAYLNSNEEWEISKRKNTYTPSWGLTLLAEKEGIDKDLFFTIYSKIADMRTKRDKNGRLEHKKKDVVKYIVMLDLTAKQKDFLYFDVAQYAYATKPTFLSGGAIKEKAGNTRGRMMEALDRIAVDMYAGAMKDIDLFDPESSAQIQYKDIAAFADAVYGKKDSKEKDDFIMFFCGSIMEYSSQMETVRMLEKTNLLTDKPKEKNSVKMQILRAYRESKRLFVAQGEAFERMGEKLKNPLITARYYGAKKSAAIANEMIYGKTQRDLKGQNKGKSLYEIFKPVFRADEKAGNNNNMKELTELVNCRHDIYRLRNGKGYTGYSIEECERIVDRISREHPELLKVADEIAEYGRNLLRMCVESGRISQADYDYFTTKYPYYAPTFRLRSNEYIDRKGNVVRRDTKVIRTAVGGNDDVLPLFDQFVRRTQEIVKACKKNQLASELARSFSMMESAEYIRDVRQAEKQEDKEEAMANIGEVEDIGRARKEDGNENIIPWYSNGKKYDIEVEDEALLYGWDRITYRRNEYAIATAFRKMNNIRRGVLTQYNPTFWLTNGIKDIQDMYLYNQHAQRLPKFHLEAAKTMFAGTFGKGKNEEALEEYLSFGMSQASIFEYDNTNSGRRTKRARVNEAMRKPIDAFNALNFMVEQTPRLAVYNETVDRLSKERKNGGNTYSDEEIKTIAAYQASDATLNFGRSGTVVKEMNTYGFTFLNAGVQGMDRFLRMFTQVKDGNKRAMIINICGLIMKLGIVGVGWNVLTDWIYGGDDEYAKAIREALYEDDADKIAQEYNEMADYQRTNYLLLNINGVWVRIPKGRLASFVYGFVYNGEKVYSGEMDALDLISAQMDLASETILFSNPITNNILGPFVDVWRNKDAWDAEIVSEYEDMGEGFHYLESDEETTDLAIKIAEFGHYLTADLFGVESSRILDISPKKLDYLIEQYLGSYANVIMPFLSKEQNLKDNAMGALETMIKKFYIDPTSSNRLAGDYYDLKEEFENIANAHEGDSPYAVASKVFGDYTDQLKALRDEIDAIGADTSLSRKERLAQISELRGQMNDLYRQGILDAKDAIGFAHANYYGKDGNSDLYEDWQKTSKGADWVVTTMSDTAQEKFALVEKDGVDAENFVNAYTFINNATADKDENGKTINGSKKEKIVNYLNSLDLTAEQKMSLYTNVAGYKVSDRAPAPSFVNGALIQPSTSNMAAPIAGGGRLTSGYGWRNCPFHGREFHQAVDIAAESGTDVGAVISGTVTMATVHGGYGNSIEITSTDENGNTVVTKYNHLLNMGVEVGDVINQGTKIGEVGSTGSSTGAHLDFRLKINNDWVDPTQYIDLEASGVVDATGYTQKEGSGVTASSGGYYGSSGGSNGGTGRKTSTASTPRTETKYDSIAKVSGGNGGGSVRGYMLPTASEIVGRSTKAAGYGSGGIMLPKASDYKRINTNIGTRVATTQRTGRTGGSMWDDSILS